MVGELHRYLKVRPTSQAIVELDEASLVLQLDYFVSRHRVPALSMLLATVNA